MHLTITIKICVYFIHMKNNALELTKKKLSSHPDAFVRIVSEVFLILEVLLPDRSSSDLLSKMSHHAHFVESGTRPNVYMSWVQR